MRKIGSRFYTSLCFESDNHVPGLPERASVAPCSRYDASGQFTDTAFPANASSFGSSGKKDLASRFSDRAWGRATAQGPVHLLPTEILPTDVHQGSLGDCWFLSAVACVAARRELIEQLFQSRKTAFFLRGGRAY